jgi:regulatory protein
LSRQRLQSDERFAEQYVNSRRQRGYGPLRIQAELREKGVDDGLIAANVDERNEGWMVCLRQVHDKKYGGTLPGNFKEQARRSRFLAYRGFAGEQIQRFFRDDD